MTVERHQAGHSNVRSSSRGGPEWVLEAQAARSLPSRTTSPGYRVLTALVGTTGAEPEDRPDCRVRVSSALPFWWSGGG